MAEAASGQLAEAGMGSSLGLVRYGVLGFRIITRGVPGRP